jgi:phage FluMu gp28-like protein
MAMPCTMWGGQLEAVSAYAVDGSPASVFARLCQEAKAANPMHASFHRTTLLDAVDAGLVEAIDRVAAANPESRTLNPEPSELRRAQFVATVRAKCRTEAAWLSQYLCQPQDDGGALLPYSLIAGCEADALNTAVGGRLPPDSCGPLYLGMDIGRKHDLSVLWLVERVGDVFWTRWVLELSKVIFREQLAALKTALRHPRLVRCCIDATGIGAMIAEEAQLEFGQYKVEQVSFTTAVQIELGMPLLAAVQDRAVRIPALPAFREDLHKIRKTTTAANNVRLEAESDDAGHADRFWALALALHAGANTGAAYFAPFAIGGDAAAQSGRGRESEILAPRRRQPAERDEVLACP